MRQHERLQIIWSFVMCRNVLNKLFEECQNRGRIIIKRAYGNCGHQCKDLNECMVLNGVQMLHHPPFGRSNVDLQLTMDALELAMTNPSINRFIVTTGDASVKPLVSKLREFGCYTTVITKSETADTTLRDCADEIFLLDPLLVCRAVLGCARLQNGCLVATLAHCFSTLMPY